MLKKLITIVLLCCGIMLYADDLDDKIRQLQRLQSELENAEKKAAETAAKKKKDRERDSAYIISEADHGSESPALFAWKNAC
ncbi:MAG: hypothetical protein LRZ88_05165 [Candidatus Cloacimonetes bacterium]|nr:hypothetical protein [Candidatus Cloacimonadota bacterium]